ncbi:GNAT family N-acetyltransferase [Paenibacillus flagellatus]|uniref:GNAT family N-acetyltransferase n=1 Tax=Paenibacillus flagellatus TaxID=2211139 RepID=A0A2V5K4K8_9BACL|nr:GNAT family N-acetyltransferase [Paenibacillus flagellatus]PYI54245.1 GNAT family N-acetyltransferase [Paenibacillus flagellatus]
MITIQEAKAEDFAWINRQYERIGFVPSAPATDLVLIADYLGERAGIGRLVKMDPFLYELGGIYTLEWYRGLKVADSVVAALVHRFRAIKAEHLYCIPFEKLCPFYSKHGFQKVDDTSDVPSKILEKLDWCLREYADPVSLMRLERIAR